MQEHFTCQRGHTTHAAKRVTVELGGPTKYADLPAIPLRFSRMFEMDVFDWEQYIDGDGYCPGNDVVSQTIDQLGIWEPAETTLVLSAATAHAGELMVDFGCHIGWFGKLARLCGMKTFNVDGDPANLTLAAENVGGEFDAGDHYFQWLQLGALGVATFDSDMPLGVVKIDVEGAEDLAVDQIRWQLENGQVGHLLMEVSPCFADYYGDLVNEIMDMGYEAYLVPDKRLPPHRLEHPALDLARLWGEVQAEVNSWDQKNLWFLGPNGRWA